MASKIAIAVALLSSTTSSIALAQSPQPPAGPTAEEPEQNEDIIVTATRRESSLQDVPISITAIGGDSLRSGGVENVRQLTQAIPNLNGARTFGVFFPTVRGVGSSGVSLADEPNVALYIDGVYQPNSLSNVIDLVEIDRVEVLRGPQGTLFGRNATGGLINIVTPDPKFETSGRVAVDYSRFGGANAVSSRGYITTGLTDKFATDLAVLYRHNDGYIRDLVRGGRLAQGEAINLRNKVLFKPSDSSKIVLTLAYVDQDDNAGNVTQPIDGNTIGNTVPGTIRADRPFTAALSFIPRIHVKQFTSALRTEFDLGTARLETTTGYLDDKVFQSSDNDASPVLSARSDVTLRNEATSQEVRLLSDNKSNFEWIVGGFYYHLDATAVAASFAGIAPGLTTTRRTDIIPDAHATAYAGFAEGTLTLADRLKLIGGVRYSDEKRDFTTRINGNVLVPLTVNKSSRWTYRGIAQYNFSDEANIYASYSTGFKSGVFNTFGTSSVATDPERIGATEVGLKAHPASWLRISGALFHYDYKGLQLNARSPNPPFLFLLLNAANARIEGGEIEARITPTRELSVRASATVLDAKYRSFTNAQIFVPTALGGNTPTVADASGKRLNRAPANTFMIEGNWRKEVGSGELEFNVGLFHSARVYYDFANRISQASYELLNGSISYTLESGLSFRVFATNLTNALVAQQITSSAAGDFGNYERPRQVGVGVQYRF